MKADIITFCYIHVGRQLIVPLRNRSFFFFYINKPIAIQLWCLYRHNTGENLLTFRERQPVEDCRNTFRPTEGTQIVISCKPEELVIKMI